MYCPRCNLHSREYVDRCPLCEGPMEVDEAGSAVMKTPVIPEKEEGTDDFFQEASFSLPEEKAHKDLSLASTIALEIDQVLLDGHKEEDTVRVGGVEEPSAPVVEEEPLESEPAQSLDVGQPAEEEEGIEESSRSRLPLLLVLVLILCIIGGLGYWFFLRPQGPAETEVAMTTQKPATTAPAAVPSPGFAVSEQSLPSTPAAPEGQAPEALPPAPAPTAPVPEAAKAPAPGGDTASTFTPDETQAPAAVPAPVAAPAAAPETTKEVKVTSPRPAAPPEPSSDKAAAVAPKPAASPKKSLASPGELPAPSETGLYSVHVGSFKMETNAFALRDKLHKKGYPVICALVSLPEKGDWYRVRVGYYASRNEALRVAARLQKDEKLPTAIFNKR